MKYLEEGLILKYVLETHFHVEYATDDIESVRKFLTYPEFPNRENEFKRQFYDAIKNNTLSVEDIEKLTKEELETQEEVNEFLINEVWKPLYGDEPIEA